MGKHRRGWGSIARIAGRDGWWVRYRKLRDDGVQIRTWAYGGEKPEDAEKRLQELWAGEEAKAGRPTGTTRLADFLNTYLPSLGSRVSPSTYRTTKENLLLAAKWVGERELRDLRRADIEAYFADLQKQRARKAAAAKKAKRKKIPGPLKPMTLRNKRCALSMCFKSAIDLGYMAENPCVGMRLPRAQQLALAYLGPAEVRRIYAACAARAPRYRDLVVVLGETGMRLGEALSLPWTAVAPDLSAVTVTKSKSRRTRTIPLTPTAQEAFRRLAAKRPPRPLHELPRVFDGIHDRGALKAYQNAVQAEGLGHLRLHDLRHAFATGLVRSGVPVPTVAVLMGHSSPMLVLTRYGHHAPEDAGHQAMRALARARGEGEARGTPAATPAGSATAAPPAPPEAALSGTTA